MDRQIHLLCCCIVLAATSSAQDGWSADPLAYRFAGLYGQVEVGGPYAGAEFHNSLPLPSRVSFFYPVANSIDLSTDYWKRADSHPLGIDIEIDKQGARAIGEEPWEYLLSPHKVTFRREDDSLACTIYYEFGMREPVMIFRLTVINRMPVRKLIAPSIHLSAVLRSCQTYARFDDPVMICDTAGAATIARFSEPQTAGTSLFVCNVGEESGSPVMDDSSAATTKLCGFKYRKELESRDSMSIVLLIGTCKNSEAGAAIRRLQGTWADDVAAYDRFIRDRAANGAALQTGDPWVDRTVSWANAILAANAHYLDGRVVPMPCPAEYNFFFTHDMLLTDLAASAFDPVRVHRDLSYITGLAKDSVIPHAYYWRDDGFKTEYCGPDNWNHLWFILAAGSYLRHTGDTALGQRIYPLLFKSVSESLRRLKDDGLMYARAPDWWDIGNNEGPRAYMTILVIRALREFTFISAFLHKPRSEFKHCDDVALRMSGSLRRRLWDEQAGYLMNFNGAKQDPHIYMGSLLAGVFGSLDTARAGRLVRTAAKQLFAEGLGIRAVMPPDFHTDSLKAYFHFAGNEAGDPYRYINGGVWPHNNAWYAMALSATGRIDDAYAFYRSTMTLDGIARSPMGQPAFYEYRYSNPASPRYGEIDKPSFLWAAGFSLLAGYRVLGIQENEWNIAFSGALPAAVDTARCTLEFWGRKHIRISGKGNGLRSFTADGKEIPSLVIPLDAQDTRNWTVRLGNPSQPYLAEINAQLCSANYDAGKRTLRLIVLSYQGHHGNATVRVPARVRKVSVDGKEVKSFTIEQDPEGGRSLMLRFTGTEGAQKIIITL